MARDSRAEKSDDGPQGTHSASRLWAVGLVFGASILALPVSAALHVGSTLIAALVLGILFGRRPVLLGISITLPLTLLTLIESSHRGLGISVLVICAAIGSAATTSIVAAFGVLLRRVSSPYTKSVADNPSSYG
jgi:hypothetical protein